MWHVFQSSQIAPLVTAELLLRYVSYIFHNLAQMLWRHVNLLCFDETGLSLLPKTLALTPKPCFLLLRELGDMVI